MDSVFTSMSGLSTMKLSIVPFRALDRGSAASGFRNVQKVIVVLAAPYAGPPNPRSPAHNSTSTTPYTIRHVPPSRRHMSRLLFTSSCYPFIAPAVNPLIKCRWSAKNIPSTGRSASITAAMSSPHSIPYWETY